MLFTLYLRRVLASILLVACASLFIRQTFAAGFSDTDATEYATSFAYLQQKGIVRGYSDGLAHPNSSLNRVEALKVILIAQGSFANRIEYFTKKTPPVPLYTDVDQSQWYTPFLEAASEKGVVTGYPDGSFRPAQLLRTEEAITMLMRTFQESGAKNSAVSSQYIENNPNQWYTASINAAINRNLIMHTQNLKLGTYISRGQFFDIVYRLLSLQQSQKIVYDGPEPRAPVQQIVQRSVAAQQQTSIANGTGVSSYQNTQPANVIIGPKIQNPNASEKYFSISMPTIGIKDLTITHPQDAVSKEGVLSVLELGVGHLFSYPGGGGKIMVYGHSSGYPWDVSEYTKVFRKINALKPGDKVYVTYAGKLHIYQVTHEQTIVAKDAGSAFQDNGDGEELILFTCWPPDSISQRYLVHAVPVETVALQ